MPLDFWAPLGSSEPERCSLGFYCPGAAGDKENTVPGSKPLIMPLGGSTEISEVVKKDMRLAMTCEDFDYDTVVLALARQYGIDDFSLISFPSPCSGSRRLLHERALQSGSLFITVTIAVPPLNSMNSSAADLQSIVNSVSDTALASSISLALGATVNVASSPALVEVQVIEVSCQPGYW